MIVKSRKILAVFLCFCLFLCSVLINLNFADAAARPAIPSSYIQGLLDQFSSDPDYETASLALRSYFNDPDIMIVFHYSSDRTFNITFWKDNLGSFRKVYVFDNRMICYQGFFQGCHIACDNGNIVNALEWTNQDRIVYWPGSLNVNANLPVTGNLINSDIYGCYFNYDLYSWDTEQVIYSPNLYEEWGPPDPPEVQYFDLIQFQYGTRTYVTISDQSLIRSINPDTDGNYLYIGFMYSDDDRLVNVSYDDLKILPDAQLVIESTLSNVSPLGVYAFDVTDILYDSIFYCSIFTVWYGEAVAIYEASNLPIDSFLDPSQVLLDALYGLSVRLDELENASVPDYELQHYTKFPDSSINGASYPDLTSDLYQFSVDLAGIARLHNKSNLDVESLDIAPRSVLVVRSNEYGLSALTGKLLTSSDIASIWSEVDVVIVLSNSDYDTIVSDPVFSPVYISVFQDSGLTYRSSWFLADWENMAGFPTSYTYFYGPGFFTQHYLMCVNNYILSDGLNMVSEGLTKLGELNKDGFQAVASSIGSVYASLQITNSSLANFIRDFGSFKDTLFTKLDLILDKLDTLVNNTDERMHDYWIRPVYDFIREFTPSLTGFGNWIDEIETDVESLPQIPVVTVPALPTLPPLIEGD